MNLCKRQWALGWIGALLLLSSCSSKLVEARGYEDVALSGVATMRLPAQFQKIQNPPPAIRPTLAPEFLGDAAGDPLDQNFWAVTHAFAFRESRASSGAVEAPALLVISRLADLQSFSSAQIYYETAARFSPDPRWRTTKRLDWKPQHDSRTLSFFKAEIEPGKSGSVVLVMADREALLQMMLLGTNIVLTPDAARQVMNDLRVSYKITQPLGDYFYQTNKAIQLLAESRRKNYLGLLETLQKEELDYTPTPRVVVFNPNLAGQFWWPVFDRSGVPAHFAIAGRLGDLRQAESPPWKKLEDLFGGMRLCEVQTNEARAWQWKSLSGAGAVSSRTQSLLQDTGWIALGEGSARQAFATLEFSFSAPIPNLSQWLNALEATGRLAEAGGLIAPAALR